MKPVLLLTAFFLLLNQATHAQFKSRELKKMIELKMPKTAEEDMPGKRGASVVWHPIQKKYYAVFAGNTAFPLAIFDATGKRLSTDEQTAMADVRGIWYNPAAKAIEGNGYDEFGWFHYTLDAKGMVNELEVDFEGMHQPDAQSAGAYNAAAKKVLFINGGGVDAYNRKGDQTDSTMLLHWGRTKNQRSTEGDLDDLLTPEDYNNTTLVYTGLPGAEIGVLNTADKQVELYNQKDGFLTQKLKLPANVPAEGVFNFAYANGLFWFFDMEKRVWIGCK